MKGSGVSNDVRRVAVLRWGDAIFRLALLLHNDRRAAATTTSEAFRHTDIPATLHPDVTLAEQLVRRYRGRSRFPPRRRERVLPPSLASIAPLDRVLLGCWLLRDYDAAQLATIFVQPPALIVERLALIVDAALPTEPAPSAEPHLMLEHWLALQWGLAPDRAAHLRVCAECQTRQTTWQAAIERLRAALRAAVGKERLPHATLEAIEDDPTTEQRALSTPRWWQQRRIWLPGLLGMIGVALLFLIGPWSQPPLPTGAAQPTQSINARDLVQAALDGWSSVPASGAVHRRVWAIDLPLRTEKPVVTDVWLGSDEARHRVEVRDGETLVEWQLSAGDEYLNYATDPAYTSCRWSTDYTGDRFRFSDAALRYPTSVAEQSAARDARLRQGAYGNGYVALLRALDAPTLRSFGTRSDTGRTLVVLAYTDTEAQPNNEVLLQIEPRTQQLFSVQIVPEADSQATPREIWRLQLNEQVKSGVPQALPAWPRAEARERLIDPACPAINSEFLVSPRQIIASASRMYVPQTFPTGITGAALLRSQRGQHTNGLLFDLPHDTTTLLVGPGRWLSLSASPSLLATPPANSTERGQWRVSMQEPTANGVWRGTAFDAELRSLNFWASGWTREALLQVFDTLDHATPADWPQIEANYLDPYPLSSNARDVLSAALAATTPAPGQTLYSAIRVRTLQNLPRPEPGDPYYIPARLQFPSITNREQWLLLNSPGTPQVRDVITVPGGQVYFAMVNSGARATYYTSGSGQVITRELSDAERTWLFRSPSLDLVLTLLNASGPITVTTAADTITLEQRSPQPERNDELWLSPSLLQTVSLVGLARGEIVQRLQIDRRTYQPLSTKFVHRATNGAEVEIAMVQIIARRDQATVPATVALDQLPPLPDDVVRFDWSTDNSPSANNLRIDPNWRDQTWVWQPAKDIELRRDFSGAATTNITLDQLQQGQWDVFEPATLWRQTAYALVNRRIVTMEWPNGTLQDVPIDESQEITVTQGPRAVMRHVLRYQNNNNQRWTRSERIAVDIGGQSYSAWILSDQPRQRAALVVEVGDTLLHFTGQYEYLRNALPARLPLLQTAPAQ